MARSSVGSSQREMAAGHLRIYIITSFVVPFLGVCLYVVCLFYSSSHFKLILKMLQSRIFPNEKRISKA